MRLTLVSVFLGLAAFAGSADVPYDVFATLTLTSFTSPPATASQDATDARVQKLMDDFDKESLRDLDRGKPAQQIEAARRLGPKHAARISPVLIKYLGDRDPANRRAAADAVWSVAARDGAALASIQPALRIALNDQDPAAAMNAAGALTAMKLPDAETAGARRRVLQQGDGGPYVLFLAARGLIGLDPPSSLTPAVLAYLFEPGTAESRQNLDIAVNAVKGLVETEDRAVIPLLLARLGTEHPATSHLLRAMGDFDPAPDGWTTTLLAHTRLRNRDSVSAAWSALGNRRDADSIKAWVPLAVARLGSLETRASALSALRAGAGRTIVGLDALVDLAANAANIEDDRVSALEIIGQTASEAGANIDRQVAAAARPIWRRACDPVLAGPFGKRFEACAGRVIYIYQDNDERAPLLAAWLAGNSDVQAKLNLLPRIQATGTYSATETVRRELAHPDPRVVKAAEATLDTIRPAWRESGARQERTGSASDASTRPAQEAAPSGPAADGAALFEAVRLGRVDEFKKTVNAGNAKTPVNYPGVTPNTPPPLGILVNYCYVRELTDSLAAMAEHLMSLGVNPDVVSQGENLLDRAKKACPPKIMQILSR